MATFEFALPDIGEGVFEGEIVKWLVKEGDAVGEDQPLVEVMTDMATVTIPSPKRGRVLKTHGKEGQMAKVHAPLVTLELDVPAAGAPPAPSAVESGLDDDPDAPRSAAAWNNGPEQSKVLASPVIRQMALEHGIDLRSLSGTGPRGRVTRADVEAAIAGAGATTTANRAQAKCACLDGDFSQHHFDEAPLGSDRHLADVALRRCRRCGRHWLSYHYEEEGRTSSGRWFCGLVPRGTESSLTAENARALLESLDGYFRGGSYFGGNVSLAKGKLRL